jgi:ubiquinone/menaquinone biosynthesis C-methylase UbiE
MEELIKRLQEFAAGDMLDVACGRGDFLNLAHYFRQVGKITAIDNDPRYRSDIDKIAEDMDIEFKTMDAAEMDFEDETFDTVVISNSLHHLNNPSSILKQMRRVLKKGGYFLINEMYYNDLTSAQNSHKLLHHFVAEINRAQGIVHNSTYKKEEIIRLAHSIHLSDYEVFDYAWQVKDVHNPDTIKQILQRMKSIANLYQDLDDKKYYSKRQAEIEKYIKKHGYASTPSVFIIAKK